MQLYPSAQKQLSAFCVEQYERDAQKLWERFYKRNGVNFFKDRHYLHKEFPELLITPSPTILEVGCGVGNSCFPLLEAVPGCQIYAIDFSSHGIHLLKSHSEMNPERLYPSVHDISDPCFARSLSAPPLDFCSLIFVLSAISPHKMPQVIQSLHSVLKPSSGKVLFRDYAVGDLAQQRFDERPQKKKLGDNFYLRGDGTRCYYFTEDFLKALFEKEGFHCERCTIHERLIENRQRNLQMSRKWVQAVFTKV